MSVGQNSGCETSREGGMSTNIIPDVRHPEKVGRRPDRVPDRITAVKHPGGMSENFRLGGMSDATCSKGDVRMS